MRNSYLIILVLSTGFFFGMNSVYADDLEIILNPTSKSQECVESEEGCFILHKSSLDIDGITILFNNETSMNAVNSESPDNSDELFFKNFFYPLMLLLAGGGITGVLIPWYTDRQKTKQNELDRLRDDAEKQKDLDRLENQKTLEQVREDRDKKLERERQDYQFKIQLKKELIESYHNAKNNTMSKLKTFHIQLFNHFATESITWTKDSRTSHLKIPDRNKKYPKEIFSDVWNDISEKFYFAMDVDTSLFVLKLSWYSQSAELLDEFENIKSNLRHYSILLNNLVNGRNNKQFLNDMDEVFKIYTDLEKDFEMFRKKIVNLQINSVPV